MKNHIGRIDALLISRNEQGMIAFSASTLISREFISEALNTQDSDTIEFFAHHIEESLFRLATMHQHVESLQGYYSAYLKGESQPRMLQDSAIEDLMKLVALKVKLHIILKGQSELLTSVDTNESAEGLLIEDIIVALKPDAEVSSEYIEQAISDEISMETAIRDWFEDEAISVNF